MPLTSGIRSSPCTGLCNTILVSESSFLFLGVEVQSAKNIYKMPNENEDRIRF